VAELPPVMVHITEHQAHGRTCPCCGEVTWATVPAEVRAHSVGAKLTGFMGLLAGVHGVSKRGIEELVEQAFDVSIALGTVSNREQELSAAWPLMLSMQMVLESGCRSRDGVLVRFCERLMEVSVDLWTFAVEGDVEPTNNHAERVLRRAVLWRRRSFGCHSADGCQFVERIQTVVQTLRQQKRSVLAFLSEAIQAHRTGTTAPRLIMG
jgi:hypothetical protein